MDNPDPIAALRKQLVEAETRQKQLCQQENASPQKLAALEREIADYRAALASAAHAPTSVREHTMKIEASTGVGVAGDVHAPINQQSGGTRYETVSIH